VVLVERLRTEALVYNLQVAEHQNFFANGILVHNCLIIDDPIKNPAEAASRVTLESQWSWFVQAAYTRLEGEGAVILVNTRWSEDDLAGRLQRRSHDIGGDTWTVLNLPALAEENDQLGRDVGEALWPEKFNAHALNRIKVVSGTRDFTALYQQRPSPIGGAVFKREWWQRYSSLDLAGVRQIIQTWDTAYKTAQSNDYSVCATWALTDAGAFLLDVWRDRVEFPELVHTAKDLFARWRPVAVVVEAAASGTSLAQTLEREALIPVIAEPVAGDKVLRATAVTPWIESGRVFIPADAPWAADFIEEHAVFPHGAHDDQVDTTSAALKRFFGRAGLFRPEDIDAALEDAPAEDWIFTG
jgi:predicted phage terminase large subunit-like protein